MNMEFKIVASWKEVEEMIIRSLTSIQSNSHKKSRKKIYSEINKRLQHTLYRNLNRDSILHTVRYVFYKIRSGIFVQIHQRKLVSFIPFANPDFTNNWSTAIRFSNTKNNTLSEYIRNKQKIFRYSQNYIRNPKKWWDFK